MDVSKILPCSAPTPTEHTLQIIQNSENALLAAAYMDPLPPINKSTSELMSAYQSELRCEMEALYGTAGRDVAAAPVPSVRFTIPFLYDRVFHVLMKFRHTSLPLQKTILLARKALNLPKLILT